MTTDADQIAQHRALGVELFNAAWDLIDKPDRSPDDDLEMVLCAAASRLHWERAGAGPQERATGDWQVAHAASLAGFGDVALAFARRNLAIATAEHWDGWRLASAHEGVARAAAVAGDPAMRDEHLAAARSALEREPDDEERELIASQLATVPL